MLSGKIICLNCNSGIYSIEKIGVNIIVDDKAGIAKEIWRGDLMICNRCGSEIITGIANKPFLTKEDGDAFWDYLSSNDYRLFYHIADRNAKEIP